MVSDMDRLQKIPAIQNPKNTFLTFVFLPAVTRCCSFKQILERNKIEPDFNAALKAETGNEWNETLMMEFVTISPVYSDEFQVTQKWRS